MPYLFNRLYKLTISAPPEIKKEPNNIAPDNGNSKVVTSEEDFRAIKQLDAIIIRDLNLSANVSSSTGNGAGQKAVISFTGASKNTLDFIKKNGVIILQAGYAGLDGKTKEDDLPIILAGQIVSKEVDSSGDTSKVKLVCSDGYVPSSAVKISREYPEGVNYKTILEDLVSVYAENGIPEGRPLSKLESLQGVGVDLPIDQIIIEDGCVLSGFLDTVIKKVSKEVGFTSYISNARIYVEPENYTASVSKFNFDYSNILTLRQSTTKNNNTTKDNQEKDNGLFMKTYLDGRLEVGKFIGLNVEDENKGSYKIVSVSHKLEYEGSSWITETELQNV